jgi:acyl carrier protein
MDIYARLSSLFQDVLDDDDIALKPETTAKDVAGWDSLSHIRLILAVEKEFAVKFSVTEITGLKNVGDLVTLIEGQAR